MPFKNHLLLFAIFISATAASGQRSQRYHDPSYLYKEAVELYQNEKYGAASDMFYAFLNTNPIDGIYSTGNTHFYIGACAANLFRNNAEHLLRNFLTQYPENANRSLGYFKLGIVLLRSRDYDDALAAFKKVDFYELSPADYFEYQFKLGYCYLMEDEPLKAKQAFAKVKDKDNLYQAPAIYYFGHIAYQQKNYNEALNAFKKIETNPLFAAIVPYYIAQIYFIQEKYEYTIAYAEPLVDKMEGDNAENILQLLAESYYETGEFDKTVQYYQKYTNEGGELNREANYRLARAYSETGYYQDAVPYYKKAATVKDSLTQSAYYYLADAYIAMSNKKAAQEACKLTYTLDFIPRLTRDALFNYAKLAYELGFDPYNEAIFALEKYLDAYKVAPNRSEAENLLINIYLASGNYADALVSIKKIDNKSLKLQEALQQMLYYRGIELFNNASYTQAIQHFNESIAMNLNATVTALSRYWKGEALYRLGKYNQSKAAFLDFITSPGAIESGKYARAYYNIGYNALKQKNYANAIAAFAKFLDENSGNQKLRNDAFVHIGDSYFMQRQYDKAILFYDKVISAGTFQGDYAILQKAILLGLQGNFKVKETLLEKAVSRYKKSPYYPTMMFQKGRANIRLGNVNEAVSDFEAIAYSKKQTAIKSKVYLQLGLIYYNAKEDKKAMLWFKKLVAEYPNTGDARKALRYIKSIYIGKGDIDGYTQYAENKVGIKINKTSLDSATYIAAENLFVAGKCMKAIAALEKYLTKFPQGAFILNANYYKAECHYSKNEFSAAIPHYEKLLKLPKNKFTEAVLDRLATIYKKQKKHNDHIRINEKILALSEEPANIHKAKVALMNSYFTTAKYQKAINMANKVMQYDKLDEQTKRKTNLLIANSYFELNKYNEALAYYRPLAKTSGSESYAIATYKIANIQFKKGQPKQAEQTLRDNLRNLGSYKYWLGKSFLLLADIYIQVDKLDAARGVLETLLQHATSPEILKQGQAKMDAIIRIKKERANSENKTLPNINYNNKTDE